MDSDELRVRILCVQKEVIVNTFPHQNISDIYLEFWKRIIERLHETNWMEVKMSDELHLQLKTPTTKLSQQTI